MEIDLGALAIREREILIKRIKELEAQLLAPWMPALRAELEKPEYAAAAAAKDSSAVFALLQVPTPAPVKELAPPRLKMMLLPMMRRLKKLEDADDREEWLTILEGITSFTSISLDDPLTQRLLDRAVDANLLLPQERLELGYLPQSALERLGCADIVTHPEHIALAMGWGE